MLVHEKTAGLKRHDVFEGTIAHDMPMEAFDWGMPVSCLSVIVAYAEPPVLLICLQNWREKAGMMM